MIGMTIEQKKAAANKPGVSFFVVKAATRKTMYNDSINIIPITEAIRFFIYLYLSFIRI